MTARQRRGVGRDGAISTVVGAILLAGIIVTALVTVRVSFVPVWEENAEAAHMAAVAVRLVDVKSQLDRQLQNASSAPVAMPLALQRAQAGPFSGPSIPQSLVVRSSGAPVTLSADLLRIQEDNGTILVGATEDWDQVGGTQQVDDVSKVLNFRVRVTDTTVDEDDALVVTITDKDGAFAGDATAYVHKDPPETYLFVRTRNAAGDVLFDNSVLQVHQTNWATGTPYWIDLLDPSIRFDRVLAAGSPPLMLDLAEAPLQGDFTIAYTESGAGDRVIGGAGRTVTDYERTFDGGTVTLVGTNQYFVSQNYVLEHGALILEQEDGARFRVPPAFSAQALGGVPTITIGLPTVSGGDSGSFGAPTATLQLNTLRHTSIKAETPAFTYAVATDHPALWASWFRERLGSDGLGLEEGPAGTGEFLVASDAGSATVTIWGPTKDPADTAYDMFLVFQQADIALEVRT